MKLSEQYPPLSRRDKDHVDLIMSMWQGIENQVKIFGRGNPCVYDELCFTGFLPNTAEAQYADELARKGGSWPKWSEFIGRTSSASGRSVAKHLALREVYETILGTPSAQQFTTEDMQRLLREFKDNTN